MKPDRDPPASIMAAILLTLAAVLLVAAAVEVVW